MVATFREFDLRITPANCAKRTRSKGNLRPICTSMEGDILSIVDDVDFVMMSTRSLVIQPNEVRTVIGILRKNATIEAAVAEPCSVDNYACRVNVFPRLLTHQSRGKTAIIQVRVRNMSVKPIAIAPRTNIYELKTVQVFRNVDSKNEVSISSIEMQPAYDGVKGKRQLKKQYGVDIHEAVEFRLLCTKR